MDNKFTQEFIELAGKYGYDTNYFSIDETKDTVTIEIELKGNRKQGEDTISIYTADTTGMSE